MRFTYALNRDIVRERYNNVVSGNFGTVQIALEPGTTCHVRDLHYRLPDATMGMRFVAVCDDGPVKTPDGSQIPGHAVVDELIRGEAGLNQAASIYVLISYLRPEQHAATLFELINTFKLHLGHKHIGAYLGEGRTTHSPERYREELWQGKGHCVWGVKGYPANVHVVSFDGVDQATLNRNARIVDAILNAGARDPGDYERVECRTADINTTLQFYRDWIRKAEYLTQREWFTNCVVHKMMVVNVMLNLPHNPRRFEQVFGADGPRLWEDFRLRYREIAGREFGASDEIEFEPLWEKEGLSPDEIRPLTLEEYTAFQTVKAGGALDAYAGRRPLNPGRALAWPPETALDLIHGFMDMYISVPDVGGVLAALGVLRLKDQAQKRLGVPHDDYLKLVVPFVSKLLVADALVNGHDPPWLANTTRYLCAELAAMPGQPIDGATCANTIAASVVDACLAEARQGLPEISLREPCGPFEAVAWLRQALSQVVDDARQQVARGAFSMGFLATPSILHRIALGMYPKNPFVHVRTICTAMDESELVLRPSTEPARRTSRPDSNGSTRPTPAPSFVAVPATCACGGGGPAQMVYALGRLGYDFGTEARRDSIKQKMGGLAAPSRGKGRNGNSKAWGEQANPDHPQDLLYYLDQEPWDAASILWTLNLEAAPVYVIRPQGPFAGRAYELLRQFLGEQLTEGVERISVPGVLAGKARLISGHELPALQPEIRGMYSWTTHALVASLAESPAGKQALPQIKGQNGKKANGVQNFLERIYYEIPNLGMAPQDRAVNFAATNAFNVQKIYESAIPDGLELDTIEVERSPVCRPDSDCWDVKLFFFYSERQVQTVRKVYRFTVDVIDVVPVIVGEPQAWLTRETAGHDQPHVKRGWAWSRQPTSLTKSH